LKAAEGLDSMGKIVLANWNCTLLLFGVDTMVNIVLENEKLYISLFYSHASICSEWKCFAWVL
jgi:hypothetical protein